MLTPLQENIIKETVKYVRSVSTAESSGHDWWHIYRVEKLAVYIGQKEKSDEFTVRLAALLHDMDDWKFNSFDSQNAKSWLSLCQMEEAEIQNIIHVIQQVSYTGAGENPVPDSIEARIVQDADRLDAIGAIGIARAFAYGGSAKRTLFNPKIQPQLHADFEAYRNSRSNTINHFYEKLLLLKDRLHTATAKKLAEKRHKVMEDFLDNFFEEWFLFEENTFLKNKPTT
jgi:uncharacterized protein